MIGLTSLDMDPFIQADEFVNYCRQTLDHGQRRGIALKLMKNRYQFKKEKELREELGSLDSIVGIDCTYDVDEVSDEGRLFKGAIATHKDEVDDIDLSRYKCAILMPFGDRNLDTIYRSEQPNEKIGKSVKTLI